MNVLLTSAGRRTYMVDYFKQALGNGGKVFASNSVFTHTLAKADGFFLTPNIYDKGYIPFLLNKCCENHISAIIPLFDIDLPVLAKNRKLFDEINVTLIVSDYKVTEVCNDKLKTFSFLKGLGLQQPLTFIDLENVKTAIRGGEMVFPCYLKPRWGMGSIGVYMAENEIELDILYSKLQRDVFKTYLKYESLADTRHPVVIQQALIGQEYGIEILNDLNNNYVATFAKKKVAMRAGETDIAETVNPELFESVGISLSKALKHRGMLDVDCFVNDNGDVFVLELNCRFGGQYPFTHLAGVNVPKQIIEWMEGRPTNRDLLHQKNGLVGCKEISVVCV